MVPNEINMAKRYLTASFKPTLPLFFPFLFGEDGDEHSICKEGCFFDEIDDGEPFNSCLMSIKWAIKEPIIVTVSIDIIFDDEIVLMVFLIIFIHSADVPIFKIGIDSIYVLPCMVVDAIGGL